MIVTPIIPTLFSDRLTLNMKALRSFETDKSQAAPVHVMKVYIGSRGTAPLIPNSIIHKFSLVVNAINIHPVWLMDE
jgi:hypothetical protein